MRRLRIVLAEDQPQVIQFLQLFPEDKYDVVGAVQDEGMLLTAATVLKPDIVIVDTDLPKLNDMDVIRQLGRIAPNCRVILKSVDADPERMAEAHTAGAAVYLVKELSLSWALTMRAIIDTPQLASEWNLIAPVENLINDGAMRHDNRANDRRSYSKDGTTV